MGRGQVKNLVTGLIVLGVIVALAGLILHIQPPAGEEEEAESAGIVDVRVAKVEKRPIEVHIEATGRIEALPNHKAAVACQVSGQLVSVKVKPGDKVNSGQTIAEVYSEDLRALAAEAAGTVESAKAAVNRADVEVQQEEKLLPTRIQQAEAGYDAAKAYLERLQHGARSQEIEKARAKLAEEQATLDKLLHGSREQEIRGARAVLAQEQVELDRLKSGPRREEIDAAAALLRAEEADLDRLRAGPRAEERAEAEAALEAEKVVLQTATSEAERRKALFDEGIVSLTSKEAAETELARARAAYESARQRRDLLKAGTRPEEIRAQEERVRAARAESEQLSRGYRSEEIQRQDEKVKAAQAQLDLALAGPRSEEVESQRGAVAQAQSDVNLLLAGTRGEDIAAAEAALSDAEARLAAAKTGRFGVAILQKAAAVARGIAKEAAGAASAARAVERKAVVKAPISGKVSAVTSNKGEVVSAGQQIVEILSLDSVSMVLDVPVQQTASIKPGMDAKVEVDAMPGTEFPAKVGTVIVATDPQSETVPVILYLDNKKGTLKDDMFGRASIVVKGISAQAAVPKEAVVTREGGQWVFVVDSTNHARERTIKLGEEHEGWIQVLEGLKKDERVVVWGQFALVDGSEVQILP